MRIISVGVGVAVVAICVWESMAVGVGDGWCLDFNSLDLGLDNWGSSVDKGMVESISVVQIEGIGLRVSLGLSLSFNRLSNNIRMISISVRVSIGVGVSIGGVWENMVGGISDSSRCLNFDLLNNRGG